MVKVKATIKLYEYDKGRKTPFRNKYRPLFSFIDTMKTSGQIILLDRDEVNPGDEALVQINFLSFKYLGDDFSEGKKFFFSEGDDTLGEGEVIEIL